jgi:hypothetical protein
MSSRSLKPLPSIGSYFMLAFYWGYAPQECPTSPNQIPFPTLESADLISDNQSLPLVMVYTPYSPTPHADTILLHHTPTQYPLRPSPPKRSREG